MLILCEDGDLAAAWAAVQIRGRGAEAELIASSTLGAAVRWEHRLDSRSASVEIVLDDGRRISSDDPVPMLNRLSIVPLASLRAAAGADYGYAVQEMSAFFLSWLHAWPGTMINRPTPQGLGGQYRHPSAWAALGAEAGFDVEAWNQGSDDDPELSWLPRQPAAATAFVVAGNVLLPPPLPERFEAPARRLAAIAGTALIGIDFGYDAERGWVMTGASPTPDLVCGGAALIDALLAALS